MNPINRDFKETSHTLMISGQRLFYRVAGAGSPLVLVHGHGVAGAIWQPVFSLLAQHYQVFVVDLPGHGRSSHFSGDWQLRRIAPLLADWLQQMQLEPVTLLGHSMGGAVSLLLTTSSPQFIQRLILVNAACLPLNAPLPILAARSFGAFFQPENGSYPPEVLRDHLLTPTTILWQSAQEMVKCDLRQELALLRVPTQIIWGERDLLLPLELGHRLHAGLPHATFVTMPQCGHCPMLAQPTTFSEIVLRFLHQDRNL
jgi:pimeloyl-ACP methyl ester carboxylesterase